MYQYLLDIILTCVRCDAGILLTKNRAWNLVSTVYDMAFCRSVTPVCLFILNLYVVVTEIRF